MICLSEIIDEKRRTISWEERRQPLSWQWDYGMLSYRSIKENPEAFKVFTGINKEEFTLLCTRFETCWNEYVRKNFIADKQRKRRYGGGRIPALYHIEDKLLFILFYFEIYPLQEVMAFLFNMSQSQASKWIHRLSHVLQMTLGETPRLPQRKPLTLEAVLKNCAAVEFRIAQRQRSKDVP